VAAPMPRLAPVRRMFIVRHCEKRSDEAIQKRRLDRFATLAMTS
jgi:hypothetical protein